MAHRRTLAIGELHPAASHGAADHVLLLDPSGRIELAIRITAEGPVLEIDALALRMKARDIVLECDTLRATAAERIDLTSAGDFVETAAGKHHTAAGGGVRVAGRDVSVIAERGEMSLRASEDLRVDGATVLINC